MKLEEKGAKVGVFWREGQGKGSLGAEYPEGKMRYS